LAKGEVLGTAGQDVGKLFEDLQQNMQDARNAKKVFDADLALQRTHDQFVQDIQKDPNLAKDPDTWVPEYTRRVQQTTDYLMGQEDLSPVAKKHLAMMTANFKQTSVSAVGIEALKRKTSDVKESGFAAATAALQDLHVDKANVIYDSLNENGIIGPRETAMLKQQAPKIAAEAAANTAITTNPLKAPELIKKFEGVIDPQKFRTLSRIADESRNRVQRENLNDLSDQMQDSPDRTLDPKALAAKVKAGEITQEGADRLLNRMKRNSAEEDKKEAAYVALDITDHDWVADDKPQDTAKKMAERINGIQNPGERERLTEKLDRYMKEAKKEGQKAEAPVHATQVEQMKQAYEDIVGLVPTGNRDNRGVPYVKGGLEKIETMSAADLRTAYGPKAVRAQIMERESKRATAARDWYANAQKQYLDWAHSEQGQKASPTEAEAERTRLGFGSYASPRDVRADLDANKITPDVARKILAIRFGI
jgi:hypothetical protein